MNLKKGDLVKIISGKDKGKSGKILDVISRRKSGSRSAGKDENKVVVEGLNIAIRHSRPRKQGEKGQRMQIPKPLDASKVMFVCPKCNQAVRLGSKRLSVEGGKDGKRARVCVKCKEALV